MGTSSTTSASGTTWTSVGAATIIAAATATKPKTESCKMETSIDSDMNDRLKLLWDSPPSLGHFLLSGPPGTGKTRWAFDYAMHHYEENQLTSDNKWESFQGHEDAGAWDLVTVMMPNEQGGLYMQDGCGIRAWSSGTVLLIDEIDKLLETSAMTSLYKLLDDPAVAMFQKPNGEVVKPHTAFRCIATTNSVPLESLPQAIHDRFRLRIRVSEPTTGCLETIKPEWRSPILHVYRDTHVGDKPIFTVREIQTLMALEKLHPDESIATLGSVIFGDHSSTIVSHLALGAT